MDRLEEKMSIAARASRDARVERAPILGTPLEEIAAERRRQVEVEGWTPGHDDRHARGQMALAAANYAFQAAAFRTWKPEFYVQTSPPLNDEDSGTVGWPWGLEWWKPKDPRRDLIRAGALIVAEIERLDRLADDTGSERSEHRDAQINTSLHSEEKEAR